MPTHLPLTALRVPPLPVALAWPGLSALCPMEPVPYSPSRSLSAPLGETPTPPPGSWTPSPRKPRAPRGWGPSSRPGARFGRRWQFSNFGAKRAGRRQMRRDRPLPLPFPEPRDLGPGRVGPSPPRAPQARHAAGSSGPFPRRETEAHRGLFLGGGEPVPGPQQGWRGPDWNLGPRDPRELGSHWPTAVCSGGGRGGAGVARTRSPERPARSRPGLPAPPAPPGAAARPLHPGPAPDFSKSQGWGRRRLPARLRA